MVKLMEPCRSSSSSVLEGGVSVKSSDFGILALKLLSLRLYDIYL